MGDISEQITGLAKTQTPTCVASESLDSPTSGTVKITTQKENYRLEEEVD